MPPATLAAPKTEALPKTYRVFLAEESPVDNYSVPGPNPETPGVTFQKWTTPPQFDPTNGVWGNALHRGMVVELTEEQVAFAKEHAAREVVRVMRGVDKVWRDKEGWVEVATLRTAIYPTLVLRPVVVDGKPTDKTEWVKNTKYARDKRDEPMAKYIRFEPVSATD